MSDEHKTSHDGNTLEGRYANYFEVGYNAFEFILDFGQLYAEGEEPTMHTRIVMNPAYAKTLMDTLASLISQYESTYEQISVADS